MKRKELSSKKLMYADHMKNFFVPGTKFLDFLTRDKRLDKRLLSTTCGFDDEFN